MSIGTLSWQLQLFFGFFGGAVAYLARNARIFSDRPDVIKSWLFGDWKTAIILIFLTLFNGGLGALACACYTFYGQDLNLPLCINIGITGPFITSIAVNQTPSIEPGDNNRI